MAVVVPKFVPAHCTDGCIDEALLTSHRLLVAVLARGITLLRAA